MAGIGEAQARLWAALSGRRPRPGHRRGRPPLARRRRPDCWPAPSSRTSFGYFSIGRLALPDLPLAFFVTLTIYATLVGHARRRTRARHAGWRWPGAAAGGAFLTKGPVGLVVAALAILPAWWLERRRLRVPLGGALVAVGVWRRRSACPGTSRCSSTHGRAYLDSFFLGDNFERFATSRFNDPRPFWFYLPIVLGGHAALDAARRGGVSAAARASGGAAAVVRADAAAARCGRWCRCSSSPPPIGKQPRYILPILPPLALLLADGDSPAMVDATATAAIRLASAGGGRSPCCWRRMAVLFYRARPLIVMVPTGVQLAAVSAIAIGRRWWLWRGAGPPLARWCPARSPSPARCRSAGLQYGCRRPAAIRCRTWRRWCASTGPRPRPIGDVSGSSCAT